MKGVKQFKKMNTKHHLTTILIFVAIFLSDFSGNAQHSSDTIRMVKKTNGYFYYVKNVALSKWEVMQLLNKNDNAYKLMVKSDNLRNASRVFGVVGSIGVGVSLGYALGSAISSNPLETKVFIPCLLAGAALMGFGIAFEIGANNKAKEGVAIYNNAIKQKSVTNLDVGFSINGMSLRLNF